MITAIRKPAAPLPFLLLTALLVSGCVTGPSVRIERAPGAALSTASSYGWVEKLGTDRADYEAFVTTRLKRAVGAALEAKGLRYEAQDPDVLINFYVNLEDRQEVRRFPTAGVGASIGAPTGVGFYHGYRSGLYAPWVDYEVEVREYQQGTLTVDVVDAASRRLTWEGVAAGRVTRSTLEAPGEAVDAAVRKLFEQFP